MLRKLLLFATTFLALFVMSWSIATAGVLSGPNPRVWIDYLGQTFPGFNSPLCPWYDGVVGTFGTPPDSSCNFEGSSCVTSIADMQIDVVMWHEYDCLPGLPPPPPPPPGAVCGNWAVESGEQCDDGNTWGGDGCSGVCTIEAVSPPPPPPPSCLNDGEVAFTDPFPNSCSYTQNVFDYPSCCSPMAYNSCGVNNRHIVICGPNPMTPPPPPPPGAVCGNWAVESGEQCDDGNTSSGDGCSNVCTNEVVGPIGGCTLPGGGFANSIISDCASSAGYWQGSDFTNAYVINLGGGMYRVCQDNNSILPTVCSNGDFMWQGSPMCNPPPALCSSNGQCGAGNNSCIAGALSDIADDASNYRWVCLGQGGSDAYCSAPIPVIPVDGSCGGSLNTCAAGSFADVSDTSSAYRWQCGGQSGGWTASCSLPTPPDISGPPSIDFGIVAIGGSRTVSVTITNNGGLPADITFSPPGGASLSGGTMTFSPVFTTVDPVGGTQTIDVTYTAGPGSFSGPLSGSIMVSGANTLWIGVDGSVSAAPATELQVEQVGWGVISDPHDVNIGALNPNAVSRAYDFVVRNLTLTPMTFDVFIQGGGAAGYTLAPQTSDGCGGGSPIVSGDVRVCRVIFDPDPSIPGNRPATIVFDNTTGGATSGDDPVRVNMDALVSGGSLAGVGSSGPVPVTNPFSNNFELDFGSRPIGGVYTQEIGITNTGDALLTGSYTNISGTFTTIGSGNVSVNPWGAPHLITVEFRPSAPGPFSDVLIIDADAANFGPSGDIRIVVKGAGNASPDLDVTPEGQGSRSWGNGNANLPFNDQEIYLGPIEQKRISITDVAGIPTTVTAASNNAAFVVTPPLLNIPANGSGDFVVTFDPDLPPGINSGSIILDASGIGPNFTVFTNGRGFVNPPSLDVPDPFPFGRVVLSKTKELDITIRSLDSRPLSFSGIGNPLGDAAFTCVSANCGAPFTLNQNETQTFTLRFTPTMVGAYSGTLQLDVTNVGMVDPGPITLTGTGIQPVIRYEER